MSKEHWNYSICLFLQFLQFPDECLGPFRTEGKRLLASLITRTEGPLVEDEGLGKMGAFKKERKGNN
jgi:hypothetical protein